MQKSRLPSEFSGILSDLEQLVLSLAKNSNLRIGYRERLRIERPIFLLLKLVCYRYMGFELRGFTEIHRTELEKQLSLSQVGREIAEFVRLAYELRVFLLRVSSENAYVRGDALFGVTDARIGKNNILVQELHRFHRKAIELIDEN